MNKAHTNHRLPKGLFMLSALFFITLARCPGPDNGARPTQILPLYIQGHLPDGGKVGNYTIQLDQGWLILGNLRLYGSTKGAESWSLRKIFGDGMAHAHAGHAHGEADLEAALEQRYLIDLTVPGGIKIAELTMTEGHYFDGGFRLAPLAEGESVMIPGAVSQNPAEARLPSVDHPLIGHTLYLTGQATPQAGGDSVAFTITVDLTGNVAGLSLALNVNTQPEGAQEVRLKVELANLLQGIDFTALSGGAGKVSIGPDSGEPYLTIKSKIKDPNGYVQSGL